MELAKLGPAVTLVGLVVMLCTGWVRQRLRAQKGAPSPHLVRLHSWGSLAAFTLIMVGLCLLWLEK